ncbi:MAG: M48 family metalloprotease [Gammaproteobacteria bacterium]|nr:M48 family metalloprotease [Gammaproteobacteria bacterium]
MGGFLGLLGWLLWGIKGVLMLVLLGLILMLFNPGTTPWLIMRMYGGVRLSTDQAPLLQSALLELSKRAGLSHIPSLYYIPSRIVNAFALGQRDDAAIAVSDGLLRTLDSRETVAVLAHELSHVRNNDIRVMGVADLFSRLTSLLSLFGLLLLILNLPLVLLGAVGVNWFAILVLIFAPNLSALAQLGLSRTREYDADLNAVNLTGDPEGLARALVKIEQTSGSFLKRILLPGRRAPEPSLLRSHPPTDERVRRLMRLKDSQLNAPFAIQLRQDNLPDFMVSALTQRTPRWRITGLWH